METQSSVLHVMLGLYIYIYVFNFFLIRSIHQVFLTSPNGREEASTHAGTAGGTPGLSRTSAGKGTPWRDSPGEAPV